MIDYIVMGIVIVSLLSIPAMALYQALSIQKSLEI